MTEQSINTFITSKNRSSTEKPSNWIVNLPSNLISCNNKQGLRVNVISFHIQNNFYNVNELNDTFDVIIREDTQEKNVLTQQSFTLVHGNYSVNQFKDHINILVDTWFKIIYQSTRNTYKFIRTYDIFNTGVLAFIKPINSGLFFGLDDMLEFPITSIEYTEALYTCTMTSFDKIVVNAYGLNTEVSSVENIGINDPEFERSSILLWSSRSDIPINAMIKYDNFDGGNSFSYNLYDKFVNSFNIILTDEYGHQLDQALDYTMLLQFTIYEREKREMFEEIAKITEYLKNIYIFFMILLEYIGLLKK